MSSFITINKSYTFVHAVFGGEHIPSEKFFTHFFDEFSLEQAGVIRREWRLAEKPVISPFNVAPQSPLVRFKYENKITVSAEMLRCLIRQDGNDGPDIRDLAPKLLAYVEQSDLTVNASGFNVGLQMIHPNPEMYIYDHFVHSNLSSKATYPVNNAIVSASLRLDAGVNLNLNILPQRAGTPNAIDGAISEESFVYVDANFDYRPTPESPYNPQTTIADYSKNMNILRDIFDLK